MLDGPAVSAVEANPMLRLDLVYGVLRLEQFPRAIPLRIKIPDELRRTVVRYLLDPAIAEPALLGALLCAANNYQWLTPCHELSLRDEFDLQPEIRSPHAQRLRVTPTPISKPGVVENPRDQIEHQGSTLLIS
jgi:hypothetical protein